jgi:hypothetical protein
MEIDAGSAARLKRSLLVLLMLAFSPLAAHGQATQNASDWAWEQIRAGRVADFNARCTKELDPRQDAG